MTDGNIHKPIIKKKSQSIEFVTFFHETFSLWKILSTDFVLLVTLSCIIAAPFSYFFLHQWLLKYEYHRNNGMGICRHWNRRIGHNPCND